MCLLVQRRILAGKGCCFRWSKFSYIRVSYTNRLSRQLTGLLQFFDKKQTNKQTKNRTKQNKTKQNKTLVTRPTPLPPAGLTSRSSMTDLGTARAVLLTIIVCV